MSTRGIDIRQTADRIVFRASLKDDAGAKVTTGTTELRLYRVEDDGTLDVYDWTTNDFVATGAGTPDDETTMTQRQRRDSSGADVDTGIWTAVLSTLTNFVKGQVYIAQVTNTGATPESQEREFQFGGVEAGASATDETADAVLTRNVSNVEATMPEHCLGTVVLAMLENDLATTPGSLLIYRTNGSTVHATKTVTSDPSADPLVKVE